jgi:hypothetical protein
MSDFDPWTSPRSYSQPFNPTLTLDYKAVMESRRSSIWRGTLWLGLIIMAALTILGASMAFAQEEQRAQWRLMCQPAAVVPPGVAVVGAETSPGANARAIRPPSRIANIYGGLDHQPTRSEVEDRQRAAGIGQNLRQRAADDEIVEKLYEELMGRALAG